MGVQHNSMLMGERGCLRRVPGAAGAEPLPTRADGQWYWPTHGLVEGDRLFVFAHRVARTGSGVFGFTVTGVDLFEFALTPGADPVLRAVHPTPSSRSGRAGVHYGAAAARLGGHTYVYGTTLTGRDLVFGRDVRVARVPHALLSQPSAWRYWDGRSWVTSRDRAKVVLAGERGIPGVFSLTAYKGGGVVGVAKEHDYLGSRIVTVSAPGPTGPWTVRAAGKAVTEGGSLTYMALGHPHLRLASGRLLVGVSRNDTDPKRVEADPHRYRPIFSEVALP
jgi:hypothetical protein